MAKGILISDEGFMITRSELAGNSAKAFGKAYGVLSGLAIGDSLGDVARKPENRTNCGITIDFNKGASWDTDNTESALLTAKTLIGCGENLTSDIVVKAWLGDMAVQDEFKRGGANEIEAANNLRKGIRPPLPGRYNAFHMSDGSVMWIGPVSIICAGNPERVVAMAEIDTSVSHYCNGTWGAQAVAVAVSMAMADVTMEEVFNAIMKVIPEESRFHHAMNHAFEIVDNTNGSILDTWMPLHDEPYTSSWATTAEALSSAFACLHTRSETFCEGVVLAANFAHDTDMVDAVVGAILGAKYSVSSIPAYWAEKTWYLTGTCLQFTNRLDTEEMAGELAELTD